MQQIDPTKVQLLKFHVSEAPPRSSFYLAALCCQGWLKGTLVSGAVVLISLPEFRCQSAGQTRRTLDKTGCWQNPRRCRSLEISTCEPDGMPGFGNAATFAFPSCKFTEWFRLWLTWSRYPVAPPMLSYRQSVSCVITGTNEPRPLGFECVFALTRSLWLLGSLSRLWYFSIKAQKCWWNQFGFFFFPISNTGFLSPADVLQYFFSETVHLKPSRRCFFFQFFVTVMCALW